MIIGTKLALLKFIMRALIVFVFLTIASAQAHADYSEDQMKEVDRMGRELEDWNYQMRQKALNAMPEEFFDAGGGRYVGTSGSECERTTTGFSCERD